jgi:hypothetical protein
MADKKENKYDLDWLLGFFPFGQPAAREDDSDRTGIPVRGGEPAWWPEPQWPVARQKSDLDLALQYAVPDVERAVFGENKGPLTAPRSELPRPPPYIHEDTANPILLIGEQEYRVRSEPEETINTLRQISRDTGRPIENPMIGAYGFTQLEVPTVYTALNRIRKNPTDWDAVGDRIEEIGKQELTDAYNIINAAVPRERIEEISDQNQYVVDSDLLDQIRSGNNINIELLLKLFDLNYNPTKKEAYESLVVTPESQKTNLDIQRNVSAIQRESSNRAINYVEIFGLNTNGN